MPHTYTIRETATTPRVTQHPSTGGRDRSVGSDHPDLLAAIAEAGEPRVERVAYVPPTPPTIDELKAGRIAEVDAKSLELLAAGFTFSGVTFDIRTDQERWKELMLAATSGLIPYPVSVYGMDKESTVSLADLTAVKQFVGSYMAAREGVLAPGRVLKAAMTAATTEAELAAIIDERT
jgi:hypothetical protein